MRVHLFPSRTQKLSSCTPTILGGRLPGKIGNANTKPRPKGRGFFLPTDKLESYELWNPALALPLGELARRQPRLRGHLPVNAEPSPASLTLGHLPHRGRQGRCRAGGTCFNKSNGSGPTSMPLSVCCAICGFAPNRSLPCAKGGGTATAVTERASVGQCGTLSGLAYARPPPP